MDDAFVKRIRAAAVAAWWTILIGVIWLTLAWFVFLGLIQCRPERVRALWGGDQITWSTIQNVSIWLVGVFKLVLWIFVLIALWLSLWARSLRRAT